MDRSDGEASNVTKFEEDDDDADGPTEGEKDEEAVAFC